MSLSHQHQAQLTRRLRDFLEELGRENLPYGTNLEIDGVVCLANSNDHAQQVVLKVHHKTAHARPFSEIKPRLPFQETLTVPVSWMNSDDMPQDLSVKDAGQSLLKASKTTTSVLNHAVRLTNKPQPAPLQLVNKVPTPVNVTSLLYQKIMEGVSKPASKPEVREPELPKEKEPEKVEEVDPALTQGENLCKQCSQTVFGGFIGLQTHAWDVHERFVCKTCHHMFTLRCNLRRHERLHEGLKPYKCDSCDKTFSRSTDLRMHMQKHRGTTTPENNSTATSPTSPATCQKCNKTFDGVETLRWHMYKFHKSQDDAWVCTICEQLFPDQESYEEHRETHVASLHQHKRPRFDLEEDENTNDDQVMRDEYQKELQAIDNEANQMNTSEQDESSNESRVQNYPSIKQALAAKSPVPVTNTSRNKRKGNPIKLVQNVSESEEDSFFEPIQYGALRIETVNPGLTASPVPSVESENDPLQHSYNSDVLASSSMSQFSRGTGDFELPTDHLQSLQSLTQIRSPLVIKPDNNASPLSWPRSDLQYSTSPLCRSPALSMHSANTTVDETVTPDRSLDQTPQPVDDGDDDKEYTCSYDNCTELCLGFKAYETHTVSTHSRYPCKLCKQTFSGKNNRTRHMRNHNRAKIYPCPDCGKYFSRPDSMREHRFIHTASYQEDKCRRCGQEFQRKSLLLAHLKNCFRQSRTKNGSIDESPYMFSNLSMPNANTPTRTEEETRSVTPLSIPDPVMRVKLENNNEAILPPALELVMMKKRC